MYSNCLIQALIEKIKDPKNVQIHILPKSINPTKNTHFYWYRKMPNNPLLDFGAVVEDFVHNKKITQHIWFNGYIRQNEVEVWENFIRNLLKKNNYTEIQIKQYEKKHGFITN